MSNNPPPEEKLDPRVQRTRSLILQAFSELLAEKGFRALTVQAIAQRAGINRATFYAHFPDKYALLQYSIQRAFRADLEKRTLSACHYSEENLQALIVTVCDFVAQQKRHCKFNLGQFDALVESEVRKQIQALLQHWLSQIDFPPKKVEIAATAATWAIYGLAQLWAQKKPQPPLEAYVGRVFPIILSLLEVSQLTPTA